MADITRGDSLSARIVQEMQQTGAEERLELRAEQESSADSIKAQNEQAVNPFARAALRKREKVESPKTRIQKMLQSGEKADRLLPIEQIKDQADQFQRRNPELKAATLVLLRNYIKPGDTKEEILKKLLEFYKDPALADEALEFLLETTDGELYQQVKAAKEELNQSQGREITAGRNIGAQARAASDKGLGTPTQLRDLYRDITGNPRDSSTLFQELSKQYAFKDLKKVTDFLLHSMGADLKSKGPSIEPGMLHRIITETRSLQAILGIYRFFRGRMRLIQTSFGRNGIDVPPELNFESMSKEFMTLAAERYPSSDKVKERAVKLGIEKWLLAKIIALSQFRDAIREVALNQIFRSLQHRDDLYLAILEALEDLEDELDQEEQQEDEEEEEEEENESPTDTLKSIEGEEE